MANRIPPLMKQLPEGGTYARPVRIESLIDACDNLPFETLIDRARLKDRRNPDYLPSEVLVFFLRVTRTDNSDRRFAILYDLVMNRLTRSLRSAVQGNTENARQSELHERMIERFVILLMKDRGAYCEALDIFEIAFDRAARSLKVDMLRVMGRRVPPAISLTEEETGEVRQDAEAALIDLNPMSKPIELQVTYRIQLRRAIDSLPDNERRVIDMIFAGIPAQSDDTGKASIAQLLHCDPKTVRNRRDSAVKKLIRMLGGETQDDA